MNTSTTPVVHPHNPALHCLFCIAKVLPGGWWSILGCFIIGACVILYLNFRQAVHDFVDKWIRPVVDKV